VNDIKTISINMLIFYIFGSQLFIPHERNKKVPLWDTCSK
jgi:hypothetical protein